MDSNKKPRYNLNLVLQETGIKADTLRAWERRYDLPQPGRSEGGQRLFSDYDIATIKWLQSRQNEGMRISQAVELWQQILSDGQDPLTYYISDQVPPNINDGLKNQSITELEQAWVDNCLQFNGIGAEQILSQAFAQFPLEIVCVDLLQTGLEKIGELWYTNQITVQQEHFASEIAVRKLNAMIAAAPIATHPQKILVGCPPGEFHTVSALMVTLLLRYQGWHVIYLGANIPTDHMLDTISEANPNLVILIATRLKTAASLQKSYQVLKGQNITRLFGGYIFSKIPGLSKRIPGHYLGDNLSGVVPKIESLIFNPTTAEPELVSNTVYSDISKMFSKNKSNIESTALNRFTKLPIKTNQTSGLLDVIEFLTDDINAALALGDLDLLKMNLDWIRGSIINTGLLPDLLPKFLSLYLSAVDDFLENDSKLILDWFDTNRSIIEATKIQR